MVDLETYYKTETDISNFEGHCQLSADESKFLIDIVNNKDIINVMEIGFNAGHSAELFLATNKNINLVSFDIGEHDYVKLGKQFLDNKYPGRLELIIGNSLNTIPEYINTNDNKTFDLIFIDGGHDYNISRNDLINCKYLSNNKTIVILDDTMNNHNWINHWNIGPNKAWQEANKNNIITELGSIDFSPTHGLSWGNYK